MRRTLLATAVAVALALALGACGTGAPASSAALTPDQEAGKQVFLFGTQPPCASCHALADAGAHGAVGANLDQIRPTAGIVASTIRSGVPPNMPSFKTALTDAQIAQVSAYVAAVAGK